MLVLSHLIKAYPFKKDLLREECATDIPPLHRGAIWFALLNLTPLKVENFFQYDTYPEHLSDRQLMVDIPRCHQVYLYILIFSKDLLDMFFWH